MPKIPSIKPPADLAVNAPPENARTVSQHYTGKGSLVGVGKYDYTPYFHTLHHCLERVEVIAGGDFVKFQPAMEGLLKDFRRCHRAGGKIIFIGNGGSAAISSHIAVDFTKNAHIRAVAFNDFPMLTCMGNDLGYEKIFSQQLKYYAQPEDWAVLISSSGKSPNILAAADVAIQKLKRKVVTFSGFDPNNPLRKAGCLNFYIPCDEYGLVEISHLTILHSLVSVEQ